MMMRLERWKSPEWKSWWGGKSWGGAFERRIGMRFGKQWGGYVVDDLHDEQMERNLRRSMQNGNSSAIRSRSSSGS